jgi:hypothetical protein
VKALDVLNWSGLALTAVGTAITAIGIGRTWQQFRPEGARFWGPVYDWADRRVQQPVRRFGQAVQGRWSKLRGAGDSRAVSGVASASFGAGVAFNARAVVTYGPLPDLGDQEAFVEEVHRRTNHLRTEMQRLEAEVRGEIAAREKACTDFKVSSMINTSGCVI